MKKLAYLESLRGLAAFIVVLNHFAIAFYPALYFGAAAPVHADAAAIPGTGADVLPLPRRRSVAASATTPAADALAESWD